MPRITYHGPLDEVTTEDGQTVRHGSTADFPAALVKRLLDQPDNWRPAKTTKKDGA